jgi:FkbM family methyltransferase
MSIFKKTLLLLETILFKIRHYNTKWIRTRYLPRYYSQEGQDYYLSGLLFNLISRQKSPWVVDVGCNHPSQFSNSLFFEKHLGCKVLAVDAICAFKDQWERMRPDSIFVNAAAGSESGVVVLNIRGDSVEESMFSHIESGQLKGSYASSLTKRIEVNRVRLDSLFDKYGIREVLLLSIDIEGSEMDAIMGIDFDKYFIACICIENNSTSLLGDDRIRSYLIDKGYVFLARLGFSDDIFIHNKINTDK